MSGVQGRPDHGVPSDTLLDSARCGPGGPGWVTNIHTPQGIPPLTGFLPEDSGFDSVPGGGVSGAVKNPDQPLGSFFVTPHAGHTCDPGEW